MGRPTYIRLISFSIIGAFLLSLFSLLFLSRLSDMGATEPRSRFFLFMGDSIARSLSDIPVEKWNNKKLLDDSIRFPFDGRPPNFDMNRDRDRGQGRDGDRDHRDERGPRKNFPPPPDMDGFPPPPPPPRDGVLFRPMPPPPPFMGGRDRAEGKDRKGPQHTPPKIWLVSESGDVIFSRNAEALPLNLSEEVLPKSSAEVIAKEDFFRLFPGTYILKLETEKPLYLVIVDGNKPGLATLFGTQAILIFVTVVMAFLLSLTFIFLYLQKKSAEARAVLLRLEKGDLKARFEIRRFDETAGLLIDFNRMAHEIEKLVTRVHTIESTRKNLLQELGHDLRTPLTSLRTSFETLKVHFDKLTEENRSELFDMIEAEVKYFRELLEQLMTIAALDEPIYKSSTETIDIAEMLAGEVRGRQSAAPQIRWSFESHISAERSLVLGDSNLIMRLLKNAFDNSSRYAKGKIQASISESADYYEIEVLDDGPGLSEADLNSFAKRREKRMRRQGEGLNFSLGLGSVIMKSIVELHGGQLHISNDSRTGGACLKFQLPKAPVERISQK